MWNELRVRAITVLTILAFVSVAILLAGKIDGNTANSSENLIRLHVVANSNQPKDQDLKLVVRDAVIAASSEAFLPSANREEARASILANWEAIQSAASEAVERVGFDYPIRLELDWFAFPTVYYDQLRLDKGEYEALRVVIGEGRGHNWWCILFPPLCLNEPAPVHAAANGDKMVFRVRLLELMGERAWWQSAVRLAEHSLFIVP